MELGTALLLTVLLQFAFWMQRKHQAASGGQRLASADRALDRIERAIGASDWAAFESELRKLRQELPTLAAVGRPRVEVLLYLLSGDGLAAQGDRDRARLAFLAALGASRKLPPESARECSLRAGASLGVLIAPETPEVLVHAEHALGHAAEARWPITRARLLQAAVQVARHHRHAGSFETALERYALARRLGEDLNGPDLRLLRASAAAEPALIEIHSGHAEEGLRLIDEGLSILEPIDAPDARAVRADLLNARATALESGLLGPAHTIEEVLDAAIAAGLSSGTPGGRLAAVRAAMRRVASLGAKGLHAEAALAAEQARQWSEGLEGAAGRQARSDATRVAGEAWIHAERPERAEQALRLAFEECLADAEPAVRAGGRAAGFRLFVVLCNAGRFGDAETLLARLEDAGLALAGVPRVLHEAELARGRALRAWRGGARHDGVRQLEQSLAILAPLPAEAAAPLRWLSASDLARALVEGGDSAGGVTWFEAALEAGGVAGVPIAERVMTLMLLAQAQARAGRPVAAVASLKQAYDLGRSSGEASARLHAGIAAMNLAVGLGEVAERLGYCEAAARLARLSGLPAGDRVVADAEKLARSLRGEDGMESAGEG